MSLRRYKTPQRWKYKKRMSRDTAYWHQHNAEYDSPFYDDLVKQIVVAEDQQIVEQITEQLSQDK